MFCRTMCRTYDIQVIHESKREYEYGTNVYILQLASTITSL